ncbi:MAG TPA: hypothetical protein VFD02_00310 [Syntrophomonadaceae bacterium]|nr:hypothetical protein [Syntrophomonadaceae bacterium]
MEYIEIWAILGVVTYFGMSIKDFLRSDWGIKKEYLSAPNRQKWQRNNAVLELGIACFGTVLILSRLVMDNIVLFWITGIAVVVMFFLTIFNERLMKKG